MNGIIFFFCKILCLFVNFIASTSFHYKRNASKMGGGYEKGLQKSQFPNSLVNWEKFRSTAQACFQKNPIFHLYHKLGKTEKSSQSNILKSQNLFVNWEQLGSAAQDQHSKTPISHLSMNWEKLYPNLNFTIEFQT